jgi:galactokinase
MLFALRERGIVLSSGFELLIYGNIPNGSGLSSSASLEVVAGAAFRACYGLDLTNVELALLGQRAENGFIGLNSGIMDQFSIACGREDAAVFLNTGTLSYEYVPVELHDNVILIMNTCKRRTLADSKYNERRSECESALKALQKVLNVKDLASVDLRTFEANKGLIENETERDRAEHVVYECARTVEACKKLRAGDLISFGRLMDASHDSLRDLYAVSCKELDALVDEARKCPGVLGARMTGAGFGGLVSEWWHFQDNEAVAAYRPANRWAGVTAEGWRRDDDGWRYRQADGTFCIAVERTIDGAACRFDGNGYLIE